MTVVDHCVDDAAVGEDRDGVLVVGGSDDVVDARFDPLDERRLVHPTGKVAAGEPLHVLFGDLLDRGVMREVAVVLGEPIVDVDRDAQRIGDGLRGLPGADLRAADDAAYREARERIGQPLGLLDAVLGQLGIGALPWLAAERQRVPDE